LRHLYNQCDRTEPDVGFAACYAIHNLRDLGDDNPAIMEASDDCRADLDLLAHYLVG
jgi:hypothetical protein